MSPLEIRSMLVRGVVKTDQRTRALERRRSVSAADRAAASLAIADEALRLPAYQRSKYVAIYLPTHEEVNTWPIAERAWRMKKRVFAPVVRKGGKIAFLELTSKTPLRENAFAILEPVGTKQIDAKRLDIAYTPLVAFDDRCERIGWGGGYYDRCFAFANLRQFFAKPKLVGLAFDCQRVDRVTNNALDIPLFQIVTEKSTYTRSL